MRVFVLCLAATSLLAADSGVPLRPSEKDYAVQGRAGSAGIAAAIVPPKQVRKMFSPEISKEYIVVEVAIYPQNGQAFNVNPSDFTLRVGKSVGRADKPIDVAPWPEDYHTGPRLPVDVTTEVGIVHESGPYGQHGNTTYAGVGVSAPAQDPPPPVPSYDPRLDRKVQRMALEEGGTSTPVAGYLYFPQYDKHKKPDEMELKYAKDSVTLNLVFPKQ